MYYKIHAMTIKYSYNITTLFTIYIITKKFLKMLKQVSQSNI